ncbi:C-type lectin 21, partial [Operophtera brumata]
MAEVTYSACYVERRAAYMPCRSSVHTIFTGVHTTFSKGVYASIEGVPLTRLPINWRSGEPDNFENSESCLVMLTPSNGTMKDVKCTDIFPFVCYKKKTQKLVVTGCGTHDTEYNLEKRTGSCYKFHRRGLSWSQAYRTCMAEGAHLAVINSELESVALKDLYASHPDNVIFSKYPQFAGIGVLDSRDGGSWMTIH